MKIKLRHDSDKTVSHKTEHDNLPISSLFAPSSDIKYCVKSLESPFILSVD